MGCVASSPSDVPMDVPVPRLPSDAASIERAYASCERNEDGVRRARREFWETCATFGGDESVWLVLRAVCEGELTGEDARSAMMACGIVRCDERMERAYDALGRAYETPLYCRTPARGE